MTNSENGTLRFKKAEQIATYNCARCDTEIVAEHSNDWLDPDHSPGEKIKLCNSCYGLIAVKDEK
jgi:uncharacterized Fe-S cluster protein YjdI